MKKAKSTAKTGSKRIDVKNSDDPRIPPAPRLKSTTIDAVIAFANPDPPTTPETSIEHPGIYPDADSNETDADSGIGDIGDTDREISRNLDSIAHELADCQKALDDMNVEADCVRRDYSKKLKVLEARVSDLAAEYRTAERRVEYDYDLGVAHIYSIRTGELLETRPLAPDEKQLTLDLPKKPPVAESVDTPLGDALDQDEDID